MEHVRFPLRGGFSVQSIFTFVLATITVALLWILFANTPAYAETDANWGGDAILYDNHGYSLAPEDSFHDASGTIPSDATVYKTPVQIVGTGTDASEKVFIIYFSSGVDPPTATSATYVEFDYKDGTLSNPQNQKQLSLTVKADQTGYSSCSVQGVGWIICPVSVFLADAMDTIFDILAGMIETQPLVLSDPNNSMYVAWNIMRTVANIAFVIVFLIIIYSQLTNLGVSNYGLKKMIPRLIVAAVLVNISFYVCALALDISNILGYAVQDVFNIVREQTFHLTNDNVGGFVTSPWSTVTTAILAGGGMVGGVYYMATGGLHLLLPLLLGLILTIIMVVIILAARQAIIILLVIVAPLAFVANLLPNTEKWFDKWKDLFITMLIFFPAFSLVFGASQLAGQIIIQNSGDNIVMLLFGLAVQIAPLVITPLLLKLSGSLLGKITQIANNPRKGIIDRSRQSAQQRADLAKQRNIAEGPRLRNPASWGAGMVSKNDFRKRRLKDKTDMWTQAATNRYEESPGYAGKPGKNGEPAKKPSLHEQKATVDLKKETIHNRHAAHLEHLKTTPGSSFYGAAMATEVSKETLEGRQKETAAYYDAQRKKRKTALGSAVRYAESSKEHAEAAQARLQAVLDKERRTPETELNKSSLNLEGAKLKADTSKNRTAVYLNEAKSNADGVLHVRAIQNESSKITAQQSEQALKSVVAEYEAGYKPEGVSDPLKSIIDQLSEARKNLTVEQSRTSNAEKVQNDNMAKALLENKDLRQRAGGINEHGADSALAGAINTVRTATAQSVTEARQIIKHFNLSSKQRQELALGKSVKADRVDKDGNVTSYTFTKDDTYAREAAIEDQVTIGTIKEVEEIVEKSGKGGSLYEFRTTISAALASGGLGGKSLYLGGKTIDDVAKGDVMGIGLDGILKIAVDTIGKGKISEHDLAAIDPQAVERLAEAAKSIMDGKFPSGMKASDKVKYTAAMEQLSAIARSTLTGEESRNVKGGAMADIEKIGQLTDRTFKAPTDKK